MFVIIQSYNEKNRERQNELAFCIRYLLKNDSIEQVYDISELSAPAEWMDEFKNNPKYIFFANNKWITYNTAIRFAESVIPKGELVSLINNDIFFSVKQDWNELKKLIQQLSLVHNNPAIVALTRHEWGGTEGTSYMEPDMERIAGFNSQDAWIWINGTIKPNKEYEIPLGIMGCDNAILHRLYTVDNIVPYNLAHKWRIYHYDKCRKKSMKTSVAFHNNGVKQQSQGFETIGALTLPFIVAVPHMINHTNYLNKYKEALNKITSFSIKYELFLKISMRYIRMRN